MSIQSSSKPHSVANTLGNGERIFNLVFKPGYQGKRLTQDALFVCELLAINPDDLAIRTYDSFSEKGLSEKIQQLRYEHYDEKRSLKLRVIQNLLLQSQQRENNIGAEALQIQNLLDDFKRSKSPYVSQPKLHTGSNIMITNFHNQNHYDQQNSPNKSSYIEDYSYKRLDKLHNKTEHYENIKSKLEQQKIDEEQKRKVKEQKGRKKLEQIEQNKKDVEEDQRMRLLKMQEKRLQKMKMIKDTENKKETQIIKQVYQDWDEYNTKSQGFFSRRNNGSTGRQMTSSMKPDQMRRSLFINDEEQEDQILQNQLQKYESKLKLAEERSLQKRMIIQTRNLNHSQVVEERKEFVNDLRKKQQHEMLNKTIHKALKAQKNLEYISQDFKDKQEALHNQNKKKQEKLKSLIRQEGQGIQQKLNEISQQTEKKEKFIEEKRKQQYDLLMAKKEKHRLRQEDKEENDKRMLLEQEFLKKQIYEKHIRQDQQISEKRTKWNIIQQINQNGKASANMLQ